VPLFFLEWKETPSAPVAVAKPPVAVAKPLAEAVAVAEKVLDHHQVSSTMLFAISIFPVMSVVN